MDRIDLYLQNQVGERYANSEEENIMVVKVNSLFCIAQGVRDSIDYVKPSNLEKWRKAYLGTLNALSKTTGEESSRKSKQLQKVVFELVESKIDNTIPLPRITPRCSDDIDLIDITENYLKFEIDRMLTEKENDRSERATYIDGTSWYKICWDSLDSNHERSGDLRVEILLADQVVPEPGCMNYKLMNYCFEIKEMSLATIYDLYGRLILSDSNGNNTAKVITYYYKNKNGIIGRFMYASSSQQVISWDEDWQIRKLRKCKKCGTTTPIAERCGVCGSKEFVYENATEEVLSENLEKLVNPYEAGETDDPTENAKSEVFLEAGTTIPFYRVRQLPFIPRVSISSLDSLYGVSEVGYILLDMQDSINKMLTKVEEKIMKSGTVVTKPDKLKMSDKDDTFKVFGVRSAEEAQMVQSKQILADVSQDVNASQLFYQNARSASGVTESFQGKVDASATSGKAKEFSAARSAGRLESLRVIKAASFAEIYDLMLKYLLAFSDETRKFVKTLPNGKAEEMLWNKYMFLRKDKRGNIYYNDDFAYSTDPAATLSNNRVQMWQETLQQFSMGTMGNVQDPRIQKLYWNIMKSMQYPLAKLVLAGIEDTEQHLSPELEQALMQSPEVLNMVVEMLSQQGEQRGGARSNSGPQGNGKTHTANVNTTNKKNSAETKRTSSSNVAQMTGGNV